MGMIERNNVIKGLSWLKKNFVPSSVLRFLFRRFFVFRLLVLLFLVRRLFPSLADLSRLLPLLSVFAFLSFSSSPSSVSSRSRALSIQYNIILHHGRLFNVFQRVTGSLWVFLVLIPQKEQANKPKHQNKQKTETRNERVVRFYQRFLPHIPY